MEHCNLGGAADDRAGLCDGLGQVVGAIPTEDGGDVRVLGAGGDEVVVRIVVMLSMVCPGSRIPIGVSVELSNEFVACLPSRNWVSSARILRC